ncbi:MAG TPA: ATP-binding cassette domain-containing protein [Candidatus Gastranaerophilales bacterium]|nr:ATP-binding cassette domain-containing protein [Candidatus Gastranaerophilales bacterium]
MKLKDVANDRAFEYGYLYKRMWPFVKPYLFRGVLAILIAIPVGMLDGIVALSLKPYLDIVVNGKNPALATTLAFWIPFAVIGFAVIQGVLKYFNAYLSDWSGNKMTIKLKQHMFRKLVTFQPAFYDQNTSGLVQSRFLGDAGAACSGILTNFKSLIETVTSSIALVGVLIYTSWQLSFFAIIVLGSSMLPVSLIRKRVKMVSMEGMRIGSTVSTNFYETFNGNRIINSFNLQEHQYNKFSNQLEMNFNLAMGLTKRVAWLSPMMYLISSFGIAGVLWFGNKLVLAGDLTAGSLASFVTALLLLYKPVKSLGNTLTDMQGSFVAMNRIMDIFDLEPTIKSKENAVKISTVKDSIKLENVWFEYEENHPVLKGINLDIKIGESIALVGNSGGGKTTIANLIPRFYDVTSGSIKIDGVDIRDIELECLRTNIAVVFQDNFLFSGTIKENILLGKFNATEAEIHKAIKDAYLDEFVAELPNGLDSEIGERGVKLSGGQKQRLAIARAMVKNAPVVILDEATSALDNKSEAIVQKALDKLMENRTVIVIAHRLSTIKNADRIAVINHGEIVELGRHEELINIPNGSYKILYDMQFKEEAIV